MTTGGQFAAAARPEADVVLAHEARIPAQDAKLDLPDGHEVAIRNTLSGHPRWLRGVVTRDAPLTIGQLGVTVGAGEQVATFVLDAGQILPFVEPAEYGGEDADTMAEAFGWSSDDWGYYYDGRAEREQTGAYRNGLDDGRAQAAKARTDVTEVLGILDSLNSSGAIDHRHYSALHDAVSNMEPAPEQLTHPTGAGRVSVYVGERDGVPVFQIDTDSPGRIRINLNDGSAVYDGDPEREERNGTHVMNRTVAQMREALDASGTAEQKVRRLELITAVLETAGWGDTEDR
ncbi:hypothetical protein HNR08_003397 [Cellulomonas hominis]|uniref:Uncharacterized protein n=1 Tax=Cellulomonas hominis TaxID=156981 RepID=A0A7W8SGH1_9CELL|nr:hypothetical protein [Cellulomonas hominis]MBB5474661.1 hypothetical protein [Cellulomonas hominis]